MVGTEVMNEVVAESGIDKASVVIAAAEARKRSADEARGSIVVGIVL